MQEEVNQKTVALSISKTGCYETPRAVTGGKVLLELGTGLEEAPKSIE